VQSYWWIFLRFSAPPARSTSVERQPKACALVAKLISWCWWWWWWFVRTQQTGVHPITKVYPNIYCQNMSGYCKTFIISSIISMLKCPAYGSTRFTIMDIAFHLHTFKRRIFLKYSSFYISSECFAINLITANWRDCFHENYFSCSIFHL
jgi:hypothetical protein